MRLRSVLGTAALAFALAHTACGGGSAIDRPQTVFVAQEPRGPDAGEAAAALDDFLLYHEVAEVYAHLADADRSALRREFAALDRGVAASHARAAIEASRAVRDKRAELQRDPRRIAAVEKHVAASARTGRDDKAAVLRRARRTLAGEPRQDRLELRAARAKIIERRRQERLAKQLGYQDARRAAVATTAGSCGVELPADAAAAIASRLGRRQIEALPCKTVSAIARDVAAVGSGARYDSLQAQVDALEKRLDEPALEAAELGPALDKALEP